MISYNSFVIVARAAYKNGFNASMCLNKCKAFKTQFENTLYAVVINVWDCQTAYNDIQIASKLRVHEL